MNLDGILQCPEHDCPLIEVDGARVCLVEYVDNHLGRQRVKDFIARPATLVFADGHTLPLVCPDCGDALRFNADHEDAALAELAQLYLVAVMYQPPAPNQVEGLVLGFAQNPDADASAVMDVFYVHLDSARQLTCPRAETESNEQEN